MLSVLYMLSILLVWYENRWIVCAWPMDRPLWFSPGLNQGLFWIVRIVISYGTLLGLWVANDFKTAAIAFVGYYVFNKLTFRIYFNREVQNTAQRYAERTREEARAKNQQADESTIVRQTYELARMTVVRNMKGERY